jgi:hypothetical protein
MNRKNRSITVIAVWLVTINTAILPAFKGTLKIFVSIQAGATLRSTRKGRFFFRDNDTRNPLETLCQ